MGTFYHELFEYTLIQFVNKWNLSYWYRDSNIENLIQNSKKKILECMQVESFEIWTKLSQIDRTISAFESENTLFKIGENIKNFFIAVKCYGNVKTT